uniref:C3H1-type domain-containing protein n=1 Tax=Alexandrium catenella TaxID=2925 RepID=A0A7S1L2U9_ALECA|mmetsp:Transcript_10524/g.28555  ORF Transcript_10524/g.28555 Transcript_10524/m.28555 type:complete len:304 (+) Transcript_10524:20-931(+)
MDPYGGHGPPAAPGPPLMGMPPPGMYPGPPLGMLYPPPMGPGMLGPPPLQHSGREERRDGGRDRGRRGGDDGGGSRSRAPSDWSKQMLKTKLCDFHKDGRCKYGSACAFAHNEEELKNMPDLRKTRICRAFSQGKCHDTDCKFAHGNEELRTTDLCYKTALCTWFEKGKCQAGDQCRFAHGPRDIRADDKDEAKKAEDGGASGREDGANSGESNPAPKSRFKRRLRQRMKKHAGRLAEASQNGETASRSQSRRPDGDDSDSDSEDEPVSKRPRVGCASSALCPRCGSTIANHLGYALCAICRL